jgi:hypothetical protein
MVVSARLESQLSIKENQRASIRDIYQYFAVLFEYFTVLPEYFTDSSSLTVRTPFTRATLT